jgi:transcriptional regulator with XRE-family HTH domain
LIARQPCPARATASRETYPIRYTLEMMAAAALLARARHTAGLSQETLATRAGTSRPTLSAYERGRKSPSLETAARIVGAAGFDLALEPTVAFVERPAGRGRTSIVPTTLPRLPLTEALTNVELPLHLNWSDPSRRFDLRDRADRARVYEIVIREGTSEDILRYVDGALLIDIWDELVLPAAIRSRWAPLVALEAPLTKAA